MITIRKRIKSGIKIKIRTTNQGRAATQVLLLLVLLLLIFFIILLFILLLLSSASGSSNPTINDYQHTELLRRVLLVVGNRWIVALDVARGPSRSGGMLFPA